MQKSYEDNHLDSSQPNPEQNNWDELAFEGKIRQKLSVEEKKGLIHFFKERGGKSEFDAYKLFATEVKDDPSQSLTHEQIATSLPNAVDLGTYQLNGLDYNRDEFQRNALENANLTESPIVYSGDSTFTYIHYYGDHELKDSTEIAGEIYGRLYLCPEFDKLPEILPKLLEKYQEKDLRLVTKVSKTAERNDRLVIYCDKESISSQLEALTELKDENPELFQNLGKNRLWGEIEGIEGIYFGQENPYAHFSYSEDRAMAVGMAASALSSIKEREPEVTDEAIEAIFDLATLSRKIDPNSWGEYIKESNKKVMSEEAEDILYALSNPEELEVYRRRS